MSAVYVQTHDQRQRRPDVPGAPARQAVGVAVPEARVAALASANLQRRNLTKGQQAVALAILYPEPDKRGRGNKGQTAKLAETADFSRKRLSEARTVLAYSRPLADEVLKGVVSLDDALELVQLCWRDK
jgi:hypothetical protein